MRTLLRIAAIVFAGYASTQAADPEPPGQAGSVASRITEVTVYADRAQVTRAAQVDLPGAEPVQFAFSKLPGWLDEGSVRMSVAPAAAGQILDVQVIRDFFAKPSDAEFTRAELSVREIADKLAALDDEKKVLEAGEGQIESMRVFSLEKLPQDAQVRAINPAEYGEVVNFVEESLRKNAKSRRDLEAQRRDLQPELEVRERKLNELRARTQLQQTTVIVTVKGAAKANATLALTYLLPGATWEPVHDLRAKADATSVSLDSYAVVSQTTGEDWEGAALTLSTQRPAESARIPELEAMLVGRGHVPELLSQADKTFERAQQTFDQYNNSYFANAPAQQREALANLQLQSANTGRNKIVFQQLQQRGTTAHFKALSAPAIRSDGRPVRVPIAGIELAAQPKIIAAPEISLNAARTVELVNTGKQPLLPGRVNLYLDGAFLGATETGFVAQGESFALYLGVVDQVKLTRTLDRKNSELSRWGTGTRMQAAFAVTVENLADHDVTLQLADRVPVSESDDVRVKNIHVTPDVKPDAKGLVRWEVTLPARQTREFRVEYAIEYPTDLPTRKDAAPSELKEHLRKLEQLF